MFGAFILPLNKAEIHIYLKGGKGVFIIVENLNIDGGSVAIIVALVLIWINRK